MRRLPPPKQRQNPGLVAVAVCVSLALGLLTFVGVIKIALLVAGEGDLLTWRQVFGIAVGLFLWSIADRVFLNRQSTSDIDEL